MRLHEIKHWALQVIDRVKAGQPVEDSQIELKASWIDPLKAARRIAGHANASGGAPILWLIGVDETLGVVGVQFEEMADWYAQVEARFDGPVPRMIDVNIDDDGKTVVVLFFATEQRPFLIKHGGKVSREVPWRRGTRTNSATHNQLIRLLSPLQARPDFEILAGSLIRRHRPQERETWHLSLTLYVVSFFGQPIVIPFHYCAVEVTILHGIETLDLNTIRLAPPSGPVSGVYSSPIGVPTQNLSKTIEEGSDEVIIHGPGKLLLKATSERPLSTIPLDPEIVGDAVIQVVIRPIHAEQTILLEVTLAPTDAGKDQTNRWELTNG